MSTQVPTALVSAMAVTVPEIKRPTANFHPSVWKNHFLSLNSRALAVDEEIILQVQKLKEEVRNILVASYENSSEKLNLINSIQRLGVSYHFGDEIDKILEQVHNTYDDSISSTCMKDLYDTALQFRLLRQQGHKVSSDTFKKFTDKEGKFRKAIANDTKSLLCLYEATHMRVHGEGILEEALDFTNTHLKAISQNLSHPLATEVCDALKQPLQKSLPRLKTRQYMLIYEKNPSHNDTLLTFAKQDFNILQKIHQKELYDISRWWKELDFATSFPFARDRIVECYFWILGVYFEPNFNVGRKILTKVMAMTSLLDDIYDAYGTFEELQVFTEAIKRWDIMMVSLLPDYMKICYTTLLDLYEEIEKEMDKDARSHCIHFAKEAMKEQVMSYFKEAEWLHKKYKPTFEEYMEVAKVSSGYALVAVTSLLGMGDIATKNVFKWAAQNPKIIEASTIIARLMNDLVSHRFEEDRTHIVSAVECYKEQNGCSEEEVYVEFKKQIVDAWKDVNEACLNPTAVPMPVLIRIVNLCRVMDVLYSSEDGYTQADGATKSLIKSILVDPLPMQ